MKRSLRQPVPRPGSMEEQETQFTAEGSPSPGKVGLEQPESPSVTDARQGPVHRHGRPSSRTGVSQRLGKASSSDGPAGKTLL
jgi:hypothetical protein